jgi:hypothetical protein
MPSQFVRVQWSPPVALACFAYMLARTLTNGLTTFRLLGLLVTGLWSVLAVYDRMSGGKLLHRLYPDNPDNPDKPDSPDDTTN